MASYWMMLGLAGTPDSSSHNTSNGSPEPPVADTQSPLPPDATPGTRMLNDFVPVTIPAGEVIVKLALYVSTGPAGNGNPNRGVPGPTCGPMVALPVSVNVPG